MKQILLILLSGFFSLHSFAQPDLTKTANTITEEGKQLYRSEMASWYGTDIFVEQYKDKDRIGGYFSYADEKSATCIFFSRDEQPKVIGTIIFDNTYDTKTAKVNLTDREFTAKEKDLCNIRTKAFDLIQNDTLFKVYKNTDLNLIPLISNGERKVYLLTGPKNTGVVIFGNDYLLNFDDQNKMISSKQLHHNIISTPYSKSDDANGKQISSMHSHLAETGDFITATDICTLMLYEKFTSWSEYMVVSKNYISIWNCKTDKLAIISSDAMNHIIQNKEPE